MLCPPVSGSILDLPQKLTPNHPPSCHRMNRPHVQTSATAGRQHDPKPVQEARGVRGREPMEGHRRLDVLLAAVHERIQVSCSVCFDGAVHSAHHSRVPSHVEFTPIPPFHSQMYSESRSDKLWVPQGTEAKDEESAYNKYFPRSGAMSYMYIEPKSGRYRVPSNSTSPLPALRRARSP